MEANGFNAKTQGEKPRTGIGNQPVTTSPVKYP
jgi:hypothetical protein